MTFSLSRIQVCVCAWLKHPGACVLEFALMCTVVNDICNSYWYYLGLLNSHHQSFIYFFNFKSWFEKKCFYSLVYPLSAWNGQNVGNRSWEYLVGWQEASCLRHPLPCGLPLAVADGSVFTTIKIIRNNCVGNQYQCWCTSDCSPMWRTFRLTVPWGKVVCCSWWVLLRG